MRLFASATGLAFFLFAPAAAANPDISGYSGKDYNGVKDVCTTSCHAKGVTPAPTLDITVPATVKAGTKNDVTIKINGTRKATVLNAALTTGSVATAGTNTIIPFADTEPSEVASGKAVTGASATYTFSFVPPNKNGDITLWVTGMSTNLANGTAGDAIKSETRTIKVTDAKPEAPDAGSSTSSSSSSSTSSGGATSSSSGGTTTKDGGSAAGDDDDDSASARPASSPPEEGGCAVASRSLDGGLFAIAVALILLRAKRACGSARLRADQSREPENET